MNLLIPLQHLLKVGVFVYFSFVWFLPYLGSVFCPRTPFFHALLKQFHFRRILLVVFTNIRHINITVGYTSFCNILYLEMMLMTLPLRLYHPRPLPYHHLLKFLVEDLTPHPCMKIARYIGIINVITAFYSVCQIREDKTYLKLSTSRLKLVLSFSAISSLLSICSLALLSLSRSRSISAFSLRDCSRSCSTANKSYSR